jgi:peroxiredoxin
MHLRVIGPPEFAGRQDIFATVLDDGELLVVQRVREVDVERARAARERREKLEAQRKHLLGAAPPEISASKWLNSPRPVALGDLKGKVVLVYYWGDYSQAISRSLTELETLYGKYRDGGLVIVGIQSPRGAEQLAKLVEQGGVKFPIAVDDGQTPERFAIMGSRSYFLIGRDGKIARSQYADPSTSLPPPGFAEIENLLGARAGRGK